MNAGPRCAVHGDVPALGPCERCGTFICAACKGTVARMLCAKCQALTGEMPRFPTPWEERKTPLSLARTVWLYARSPAEFSRRLDPKGPLLDALQFTIAVSAVTQVVRLVRIAVTSPELLDGRTLAMAPAGVASTMLLLLIASLVLHGGVRIWRAHALSFAATQRLLAYAFTPLLVAPLMPWSQAWFGAVVPALIVSLYCLALVQTLGVKVPRMLASVFLSPVVFAPCCFVALYNFFSKGTG